MQVTYADCAVKHLPVGDGESLFFPAWALVRPVAAGWSSLPVILKLENTQGMRLNSPTHRASSCLGLCLQVRAYRWTTAFIGCGLPGFFHTPESSTTKPVLQAGNRHGVYTACFPAEHSGWRNT